MTTFENAPFKERFAYLGDTSEAVFKKWAKQKGITVAPFGFHRPNFKFITKFASEIRCAPDFACEGVNAALVEVKGCGNEGLKIKQESLDALQFWNKLNAVQIFVYNSATKMIALLTLDELLNLVSYKEAHYFPDGAKKKYYIIPIEDIAWEKP